MHPVFDIWTVRPSMPTLGVMYFTFVKKIFEGKSLALLDLLLTSSGVAKS